MPAPPLLGFILTRNWRDTNTGTEIEYWLATESGPLKVVLTKQISVAFVEAQHKAVVQAKLLGASDMYWRDLDLKSFQNQPVLGIYAKKFRQLGKLAHALQPQGAPLLEADVRPHERYLMKRFITAGVETFSRQGSRARRFYDRLKTAAPNDIYPLCGQRVVKTLDHYLPKASYPTYALTPLNLVPACSDCNKSKLDRQPADAGDQTLHPYFDDVDDVAWLVAEIRESTPPAAVFSVRPPANIDATTAVRLRVHFETFGLGELYAAQAGSEMVSIRFALAEAAAARGMEGVQELLAYQARTRTLAARNSWVAALYTALAQSAWFCSEGYALLG